jgi:ribosomal protein L7/L12
MPPPSAQTTLPDVTNAPRAEGPIPQAAVSALWRGNAIEAIRLVRQEQHIGLKEAKDQVDAYLRSQPILKKKMEQVQADSREGLLRWLVFLLAGGSVLAYFLT